MKTYAGFTRREWVVLASLELLVIAGGVLLLWVILGGGR